MTQPRDCPNCGKRVRPVVRDPGGPKCPVCQYRFRPDPRAPTTRRWYAIPENAHHL